MAGPENVKNGDKLGNKEYMKALRRLQAELCKLQEWVKYKGISLRGQGSCGLTINCSPLILGNCGKLFAIRHPHPPGGSLPEEVEMCSVFL